VKAELVDLKSTTPVEFELWLYCLPLMVAETATPETAALLTLSVIVIAKTYSLTTLIVKD